jgi:hypothetical protein
MYVLLIVVCPFVLFLLVIVLSVLLRYKDSDYSFANWYLQTLLIIHYTISITHNQSLPNNVILIQLTRDHMHIIMFMQRSTKHTYKTKDRVTRTPLKTRGELRCSRKVSNSCSTSVTRRVNLATSPVISHGRGRDREVLTTDHYIKYSILLQFHRQSFQTTEHAHNSTDNHYKLYSIYIYI